MAEKHFRHELKYVVSNAQVELLKTRLKGLLNADPHAGAAGGYRVRSLYFDDFQNRCYYENENGTDPREKFRIRIYNNSPSRILLECKRKERGMTHKDSCLLTEEQARRLMDGKPLPNIGTQPPLLQKLTLQMLTRRLKPVVMVEYDRIPFVCENGNVRITLDLNICASAAVSRFFDPLVSRRSILPTGQQLLEVKYDQLLPDPVYRQLQLSELQQTAFSKYYLCRKYMK